MNVPKLWETREESERSCFAKNGIGCEIGVFKGKHAQFLLGFEPSKLYLVDPWCQRSLADRKWRDSMYHRVCSKFSGVDCVEIVRARSIDAAGWFDDDCFDWIVVDGDHTRDGVIGDISAYYPKLRSGGIFSCHDYNRDKESTGRGFDVPAYYHEAISMFDDLEVVGQSSERIGRNLIVRKK